MIEYPTYMQTQHETWLTAMAGLIAGATNPFTGLAAYDPTTDLTAMGTAISTFAASNTAIVPATDIGTLYAAAIALVDANILPDSYITARIAAHSADLDTEVTSKVLPRFEAGMRDINAVMTSAFAIGRAIIEKDRNDKVDKFAADMRLQADAKRSELISSVNAEMLRLFLQKKEFERAIAAMSIDYRRLAIAGQNDYKTETKAIESDEMKWPMEIYKYGANLLAGIGGGTTSSVPMDGNKTARVVGSGLSGAAAGAMIGVASGISGGGGYGAIAGGIAGLLSGFGG